MSNEIMHYGVKGMKWGIRRTPEQLGRKSTRKENREAKQDRKTASKNRRTLSDAELKSRVERLKMEKQLKELTDADLKPGRTATKKAVKEIGGKVLKAAVVGSLVYAGKVVVSGKFDPSEAANYIFPNPNKKK